MQGYGAEEGCGGGEVLRGGVDFERVVEVVGCADGAGVEGAGVREDGVADVVAACWGGERVLVGFATVIWGWFSTVAEGC